MDLLHGPRHPLDDAVLQPILEAVDQALRPADQDVGVRAQLLVGPSQNVSEVGPRADGREDELRGGVSEVNLTAEPRLGRITSRGVIFLICPLSLLSLSRAWQESSGCRSRHQEDPLDRPRSSLMA